MSLLRANFAFNIQAIQSGVWKQMKLDGTEEETSLGAPKFRVQFFSEATNPRYRIAMNNARQKSSPFYGVADGNVTLWNEFIKDCLIEFGLKDWERITQIDLMGDKEISDRTLAFIRENIDQLSKDNLPSEYVENKYLKDKDGIMKVDGRAIYYNELIGELADIYTLDSDVASSLIEKAEVFFEKSVPCTQKNIKLFLNEPRNALAFRFCADAAFTDKPYRSSF